MKKNQLMSMLLAGLISFGSNMPIKANAETKPLNIKSMYNMSEEDSMKKVKIADVYSFSFSYYGKNYYLPILLEKKKAVYDYSYVSDDDSLISISEINESFSNSKYPHGITTSVDVNILREVSSREIILIVYDQYGKKTIIENEDYFKHLDIDRFEKTGSIGINEYNIANPFYAEVISSFPKTNIDYDSEITIKEIKELTEKIDPRMYWPISEISTEKNNKLVLPQYTEEFLNTKINLENKELAALVILETRDKLKLILINRVRIPFTPTETYDLITGEKIENSIDVNENKAYFKKIGIKFPFYSSHINTIGGNIIFGHSDFKDKQLVLQDLVIKMGKAETIGELIEMYSYVPEGFEPDYSKYDFSKNPNVVKEPKPGSKDFHVDYEKGYLYPIDKPKIKELTKES